MSYSDFSITIHFVKRSRLKLVPNMFVFVAVVLISVLYYIYFRQMRRHLYKLSDSLPDIGYLPIIGNTHWFIGGPEKILNNIRMYGNMAAESGGIAKVWIGPTLYIITFNLDDVQKILETCLKKDYVYKFLRTWLGDGLFVAPVDLWKAHRKILVPIFHKRLIEDYIDVFGQQASILIERLEEKCGDGEFDVHPYITSCMLDVVFETAMGEKMEVQRNPETPYLRARSTVMSIINMRLFKAWMQPDALFNLTSYSKTQKENIEFTHKFTDEVVQRKKAEYAKTGYFEGRKDLLALLLESKNNFTNEQLREHIDSITIAGNDTTALVISYALLLLGCHSDEQELVYKEQLNIFGDSTRMPTKDDLSKMEYLERVIKETMRLYTVVPIIGRETDRELKLSSCTVPKGVGCAVLPFLLHRSKKLWGEDADFFKPDRFLPENSRDRHPCAFIPFSYGSRNCIGRHFGMLATKNILSSILRHYKVKSRAIANRLKIEILLFPVNGHMITLEKRDKMLLG